MKYIKSFELFEKELETAPPADELNDTLRDIRHFRGSTKQFKDFFDNLAGINKHPASDDKGNVNYEYPKKYSEKDNSTPYQDFANGQSALVKRNDKRA